MDFIMANPADGPHLPWQRVVEMPVLNVMHIKSRDVFFTEVAFAVRCSNRDYSRPQVTPIL